LNNILNNEQLSIIKNELFKKIFPFNGFLIQLNKDNNNYELTGLIKKEALSDYGKN
jgi:hypothetical protein